MAVPFAPPLGKAETMTGESDRTAVRRWRAEVFVGVKICGHWHGSAAVGTDAKDVVHPGDVAAAGGEIDPTAIRRPRVELIITVIESQAFQLAGVQREHVDVAISRARRNESQP